MSSSARKVALVTLGCARNEVDSEELAGRLAAGGFRLVDDPDEATAIVVNTCGFIDAAKKDSIDTLLDAADRKGNGTTKAVVAVGCMAERYGRELADSLPEADAVLGFDSYADLAGHLDAILHGERPAAHTPRDRRTLLPLAPAERARARIDSAVQLAEQRLAGEHRLAGEPRPAGQPEADLVGAPASGPPVLRRRLDGRPWAPLKLASGCDRRCSFCAIPAFRGAFVSRRPTEVLTEARWLAERGVRELFLVSENSTSYGKDLGDLRLLESLLPQLAEVPGLARVRVSYLQPAEVRPGLIDVIGATPGVVPYFDLSFQHSAPGVLRRMRRFGGSGEFLTLIDKIRSIAPAAGIRSNVIVGFPGESADDLAELEGFLSEAMLDVVGVFGYSDEDGTEAAGLDGKLDADEITDRVTRVSDLVEELTAQRALARVGDLVEVLVEEFDEDDGTPLGRAAHQGPEVDGLTRLLADPAGGAAPKVDVGELVTARVFDAEGVDLLATVLPTGSASTCSASTGSASTGSESVG
jgi:ribosomal protein S12 methylthiotransferase RimO